MTQINAYLTFSGKCREAMTFYKECLGGELTMTSFGDSPMAEKIPAAEKNNIMHALITKDGMLLMMASDGMAQNQLVAGNTISLSLNCTSENEIVTCFAKLSSGGQITMPLADQFWGAKFGMLIDKYGIRWMLNYDKKA